MKQSKLIVAVVVVHLITNLLASIYLITFQFDAQRRSSIASQQREDLKKQNDYLVCILLTNPNTRSPEVVSPCKDETVGK